jgi:2-methylcitrate dehydratase
MPSRIRIFLRGGQVLERDKRDYEGFFTRPMPWEKVEEKFERLSAPYADGKVRREIVETIRHLEATQVSDLSRLVARVGKGR